MKERSFHATQFKRITQARINKAMLASLMTALETLVSAHDKSEHPKHLSYKRRNLVILDSLCRHLHDEQPLNVEEEDNLYGALSRASTATCTACSSITAKLHSQSVALALLLIQCAF